MLLWALGLGATARGQGEFRIESHVFSTGYSPPAVGNAGVQANVVVGQDSLTGEQQYGDGDGFVLGFMATVPHRDSDGDGVIDPHDGDTDGDGIPDSSDGTPYDADDDGMSNLNDTDDDNDGQSDHDEGVAGTDPLNANSLFRIDAIQVLPNGDVQLVWDGVLPRTYRIYTAGDLTLVPPWISAGSTNATSTSPIHYTLPGPASNSFFRLDVSR